MALRDGKATDTAATGVPGRAAIPPGRVAAFPRQEAADAQGNPSGAARGLMLGLAIGVALWVVIIIVAWRLLRG